ncbi:hypothetical protein OF83DRAFT_1084137, partial [Amylostereum chailletii]
MTHTQTAHSRDIHPSSTVGIQGPSSSPITDQSSGEAGVLVRVLCRSLDKKRTYKEALERMNGVNNRTTGQWTDYYLEHKDSIDTFVSHIHEKKLGKRKRQREEEYQAGYDQGGGSSTVDMCTLKSTQRKHRIRRYFMVPPSHSTRGRIPSTPKSEPKPPSYVPAQSAGRRGFTPEDKDYLAQFMLWELSKNPHVGTTLLSRKLSVKLPHHPQSSWLNLIYSDSVVRAIMMQKRDEEEHQSMVSSERQSDRVAMNEWHKHDGDKEDEGYSGDKDEAGNVEASFKENGDAAEIETGGDSDNNTEPILRSGS